MGIPVFVNGLLPASRDRRNGYGPGGSMVYMKVTKQGQPTIEKKVFASDDGAIEFDVPYKYVGAEVLLHIRHPWYKPLSPKGKLHPDGFFHTEKIEHDYTFWSESPSTDKEWQSEKEFTDASAIKNARLRAYRHKNIFVKCMYWSLSIGLAIAGFIVVGLWLSFVVTLASLVLGEVLGKYTSGLVRWVPRVVRSNR